MDIKEIFEQIITTPYQDTKKTSELQSQIYKHLETDKNSPELLILLMQSHIALAQKENAVAVANKIWEEITTVETSYYILYLNNLINIGLFEMASEAIKPFVDNIQEALEVFPDILIKFAIITGNLGLLNKINSNLTPKDKDIDSLTQMLKAAEYQEPFDKISKIIISDIRQHALCIETQIYQDETNQSTNWQTSIYINGDEYQKQEIFNKITANIDNYLASTNQQYWLIPDIEILDIEEY